MTGASNGGNAKPESPSQKVALTLLVIDDDPLALELISETLAQDELRIVTAADPAAGLEQVARLHPQIVLLDLVLPGMDGIEVLERILEVDASTDVILMTAHSSTGTAVEAIRKGACDYITKPLSIDNLRHRVDQLVAEAKRWQRALQLDDELLNAYRFQEMVGRSPLMLEVFARIRRVAPHFQTALVMGVSGTGKELVARALHQLSPTPSSRFAVCNCSAVVETLFESELFGHVRGAFTGATRDKVGFFEYADGGTLFLDEIGDMPLATQSKLLRALQSREFQRVGSPAVRTANVRVVAATNRDLASMMRKGEFREDLYYRLASIEIKLPRLADRKEDLPLLERHFLERMAVQYHKPIRGLTRRAQALLARYDWPGNVRELENVLGSACMMADGEMIDVRDLPGNLRVNHDGNGADEELLTLVELERRHVAKVLSRVGGNKVRAAEVLGISRTTLYRILEDVEVED